jgi:methylthioribulose-1-phosphate dehydratase
MGVDRGALSEHPMNDFASAVDAIVEVGRRLDHKGLVPATAGNFSVRLGDGEIAVTASSCHKGRLSRDDVMRVSAEGLPLDGKKPSAETLLHCLVYAIDPRANGVLHTHSVAGVVLSRALIGHDAIRLEQYELLKIFPGIDTHDAHVSLPLVDNSQDMTALAAQLRIRLIAEKPLLPAFYIRGHGLYAWGSTLDEAEFVVEACEYLLACELETLKLPGATR